MTVSILPRAALAEPAGFFSPPELLRLLRRRAPLIAVCALGAAVATFAYAHTLPPVYTASAQLAIDSARFIIPQLQGAAGAPSATDPGPIVQTEAAALSSRQMIQGVINYMHLDQDAEFNPALRPPTRFGELTGWIKSFMPAPAGPVVPAAKDAAVFGEVDRSLKVLPGKLNMVIELDFTSLDPNLAAVFVDVLIREYIGSLDEQRRALDKGATTELKAQLQQAAAEIDGLQQRMSAMRTKTQFVGLPVGSVVQQQLQDLANAATQASVDRAQIEAQWQRAEVLARQGNPEELASVLNSATISRLRDQETTGMQRVADLSQRYGANYPGLQSARADVAVARRQLVAEAQRIVASLSTQLTVARAHEAETKRQLEVARQSGLESADAQAQIDALQKEIDARRQLYNTLLQGLQQADSRPQSSQSAVPEVRVLSKPVPPQLPSGPNKRLAAILGFFGGGMVGLLLTVGFHRGGPPAFASAGATMQATGLPVLATLPRLGGRGALALEVLVRPDGRAAEELRALRSRLRGLGGGRAPRNIAFTSAGRREDASNVAAAFARLAASEGERVLLIEGDLQRPWLGDTLGAAAGGLVSVVESNADWRDRLARDAKSPLDLLLSGHPVAPRNTLTAGTVLPNLLVEAAEDYTLIVIDAPPAATVANTAALASHVDATVVVIDGAATMRQAVGEAMSGLAGARNLAVVLVGVA